MSYNVLIVEDEPAIAELEKDYLELSDIHADIAQTGPEGLEKALTGDYELVVLDLMLPGMDGFDVLKEIRERKNIPILLVSAKKEEVDK
ncbi:MAG: response regulator, partial [Lachnospiraceae bacterium]|nr:response regulator [Lachnospiraceae bacterium]